MAVNNVTTSNVRWYDGLSTGDGCGLGKTAASKVGFHGTAPTIQTSLTALATAATIGTVKTSVQQIIARLQAKGLFG